VWTQAEHLAKWFGPKGCTLSVLACELRPGGSVHYCMRFPGAPDSFGKWAIREVAAPDRLVFLVSFADAQGKTIRATFDANWPREMLSVVTFEPHAGIGKGTVITVQWSAHEASAVEQKTFDDGHDNMSQGWAGTFDKLVEYLATAK
jgi:uncharacterized protein YndB with AHSA1/START domain